MNKYLRSFFGGLSFVAVACQQSTAPQQAVAVPAASVAPKAAAKIEAAPATPKAAELTPEMRAFLEQNNLAALWQTDLSGNTVAPALNGFCGLDHQRIAFVLSSVVRDILNPTVYHVTGKNQYKKAVTPFVGTITVTQLADLATPLDLAEGDTALAYTATARFDLRENSNAKEAGIYTGTALMDFYRKPDGKLELVLIMSGEENPTGGGGLLFRGEWIDNQTNQRKPVAWASFLNVVVPDALSDFFIGDRGEGVNPKYAKLGWDEYWENDEWWAEPGTLMARAEADSL